MPVCPSCNRSFPTRPRLTLHIAENHLSLVLTYTLQGQSATLSVPRTRGKLTCPFCLRSVSQRASFRRHLRTTHTELAEFHLAVNIEPPGVAVFGGSGSCIQMRTQTDAAWEASNRNIYHPPPSLALNNSSQTTAQITSHSSTQTDANSNPCRRT
ncbi:hypothetical protein BC940DRAFT_295392 [Gongronella butleri]|nr:hypothetical protein BC940DRAFT_295392 [Gongronella butleri]